MYPPYEPFIEAEMAYRRERVSVHFANGAWLRQQRVARKRSRRERHSTLRRTLRAAVTQ